MTKKQFFKSKCPTCESSKIYFHHDGDNISLNKEKFSKEATCQDCANKFTITGQIKGPLQISQIGGV